jgi:hypothetical protein
MASSISGAVVDGEVAGGGLVLETMFDLEEVVAAKEFELHAAGDDDMVVPEREFRHFHGDSLFVLEMQAKRDRQARLGIDDLQQQLAGGLGLAGGRRRKQQRSAETNGRPSRKSHAAPNLSHNSACHESDSSRIVGAGEWMKMKVKRSEARGQRPE